LLKSQRVAYHKTGAAPECLERSTWDLVPAQSRNLFIEHESGLDVTLHRRKLFAADWAIELIIARTFSLLKLGR
jgi:hypothetical protein